MSVLYVLLAVSLGTLLAFQAGVNGQLRVRVGNPIYAALISTSVSTTSLLGVALVVRHPLPDGARFAGAPWWVWTGGFMGALNVALALVLVTRVGAAVLFASLVVGQMVAAIVIDHFGLLGVPQHAVNPWRITGALCLVTGLVLIRRF